MNQPTLTPVRKAVFPVAGLGTRFLPATKASPKEMLAVVDKPLIQYAVEEAIAAGITELIFVTGRNKRAIEDHFDSSPELELELQAKGKLELLLAVQTILPKHVSCIFVRQAQALGLGHAVLCARPVVGNEPFAVILADDLMVTQAHETNVTMQLINAYNHTGASIVAVQHVPRVETSMYGIVAIQPELISGMAYSKVTHIVEKPNPEVAPSTLAVAGRYVLTADIFEVLSRTPKGKQGEIQLTDGIEQQITTATGVYAHPYSGRRYDCGSKLGLMQATVDLGKVHPEVGAAFSAWLSQN